MEFEEIHVIHRSGPKTAPYFPGADRTISLATYARQCRSAAGDEIKSSFGCLHASLLDGDENAFSAALKTALSCETTNTGALSASLSILSPSSSCSLGINCNNSDGLSPLLIACALGDREKAAELIRNGADVEHVGGPQVCGVSPLMEAANASIASLLIDAGADAKESIALYCQDLQAEIKRHPLHVHAHFGRTHVVELLVKRGVDVDTTTSDGNTALALACFQNHVDTAKKLIDLGANIHVRSLSDNISPLRWAVLGASANCVQLLLDAGVSLQQEDEGQRLSLLSCHVRAANNNADTVRALLQAGADVNCREPLSRDSLPQMPKDVTPLFRASGVGKLGTVAALLEAGADVHAVTSHQQSCLGAAAYFGRTDIVTMLLDAGGADFSLVSPEHHPLRLAVIDGHHESARVIWDRCRSQLANSNTLHDSQPSIILAAAFRRFYDLVEEFLDVGISDASLGSDLFTIALAQVDPELIRLIGKRKLFTQWDQRDDEGSTPLSCMISTGEVEMVKVLLDFGADPSLASANGFWPLQLAARHANLELVKSLLEAGADPNYVPYLVPDAMSAPPITTAVLALANYDEDQVYEVVKHLLKAGATANTNHGLRPVGVAIAMADSFPEPARRIARLLLHHGALLNEPVDHPPVKALDSINDMEMLKTCIEHGGDVSVVNSFRLQVKSQSLKDDLEIPPRCCVLRCPYVLSQDSKKWHKVSKLLLHTRNPRRSGWTVLACLLRSCKAPETSMPALPPELVTMCLSWLLGYRGLSMRDVLASMHVAARIRIMLTADDFVREDVTFVTDLYVASQTCSVLAAGVCKHAGKAGSSETRPHLEQVEYGAAMRRWAMVSSEKRIGVVQRVLMRKNIEKGRSELWS